jgi:coenzyme F420-reducing hydrogenase delta subunit/ferredoxin
MFSLWSLDMFEPKIIAFLCTWCSYTGADTAGIARMKSPANLRAVRVPCSGRVAPELVMRCFDEGADGVLVLGCHIGECHYDAGNHRAAKRLPVLHDLMSFAGLEPERFRLDWVSASEGERFSHITTEFTETVRALGPAAWNILPGGWKMPAATIPIESTAIPMPAVNCAEKTDAIREKAQELLTSGEVGCVIGYELGPRGRTRPAFIYSAEDVDRLVWNPDATSNLTRYLPEKLRSRENQSSPKVAVVVKPCDSLALNVLVAENQFNRSQVHVLGVSCEGIRDRSGNLQNRCVTCQDAVPVVYDTLISGASSRYIPRLTSSRAEMLSELQKAAPAERLQFWLSQFDRCIRCYACRQACPMCNCPTCLAERDDATWVGLGIRLNEKRTFHLMRAYHLAGRCVGCNECERACPMEIPIGLLNRKLSMLLEETFDFHAGLSISPSPIVTVLSGEYKEG